jgi:hypothetical protein
MMGTKTEAKYRDVRSQALDVLACLENECRFRVFYAGRDIETRSASDEADFSIAKDIRALEQSQYFLLFYPERVVSSVLVEAGIALALKKKAVYFVRSRKHLPFLLQKVESVATVKICEFADLDRILTVIRNHRRDLFEPWLAPPAARAAGPADHAAGPTPPPHPDRWRLEQLQHVVAEVSDDVGALLQVLDVDVPSTLNKIRYITEKILYRLCVREDVTWGQAEPTLERMLGPLIARGAIPKHMAIHARTIQANTSPGSHYQELALSVSHALIARQALEELLAWFATQAGPPPDRPGRGDTR